MSDTFIPTDNHPKSITNQIREVEGDNRGTLSNRDEQQRRAIGQDDPITAGSRQGRERNKLLPDIVPDDES